MENKNLLKKYRARIAKESFLKAIVGGLAVGFTFLLIGAIVAIIAKLKIGPGLGLCLGLFVVTTLIATLIFYFKLFLPTMKDTAKRIDDLGLEERVLTMMEYENDDSYIAKRQREDAIQALNTVNEKLIKIAVSVPLIVALSIAAVLGSGATTVYALSETGVIKPVEELIPGGGNKENTYELTYEVKGEGVIEGDIFQVVDKGGDGNPVMAVAADDWVFLYWSDGNEDPYRVDLAVNSDITVVAVFQELQEEEGKGEANGEGEGSDEEGDPGSGEEGDGNGQGKDNGEGDGGGRGGRYEDSNKAYDGETYYGDRYEEARENADKDMGDGDIPDDVKDLIDNYYEIIAK